MAPGSRGHDDERAPLRDLGAGRWTAPAVSELGAQIFSAAPSAGLALLCNSRRPFTHIVRAASTLTLLPTSARAEPSTVESGDLTRQRKKSPLYENPAEVLARLGVDAATVEHVVLTHLHWDHAGGVHLSPRATFYVQEAEYHFWTQDPIAARPPFANLADEASLKYLAGLEGADRLVLLGGDREILPEIECLLAPGHTPGQQAVVVDTAQGRAIVGSDCAHVFRNYREDWPSAFSMDLAACLHTYEKLQAKASSLDIIFPGHDVLMYDNYPRVVEGVTQLV